MKKLLLLFAALCCMMVAKAANEVARVTQDGIKFTLLDDCTAVISGDGGQNATGAVVLPSTITYEGKDYTLTRIDNGAFRGNDDITSVTIPNTVTMIGYSSFEMCKKLTSITIPNSVSSIGDQAFHLCSSLQSVTIGAFVQSIGDRAFYECSISRMTFYPTKMPSLGYIAIPQHSDLKILCMDTHDYTDAMLSFVGEGGMLVVEIKGFGTDDIPKYYNSVIEAIDLAADRNGLSIEEKSAIEGYKTAISEGNEVAGNELAAHKFIALAGIRQAMPRDGLYEKEQAEVNEKMTSINNAGSLAALYTAQKGAFDCIELHVYKTSALAAIEEAMQGNTSSKFLQYFVKEQVDAIIGASDTGTIDSNWDTAVNKLKEVLDTYNTIKEEGRVAGKADAFGSLGTKQNGPAVKVTDKDDNEIILYAPKKVEYIKVKEN